jgi:5'-methylthioadenosine phosphorylase
VSAGQEVTLGVFGGSGFYAFLDDVEVVDVDTPFGRPAAPAHVGTVDGRRVAFLPRHGRHHELPAHRIDYRANLWALRSLGVGRILAPYAAGSLQPHVEPGDLVICDQLVDRTSGRPDTFFDGPQAHHVPFADPFCPELRDVATAAARQQGLTVHPTGTVVVVQGPRFSTRAESRWFRQQGWEVVNMTQHPEAVLARELGVCYAGIAPITDYDAGVDGDGSVAGVTQEAVFAFFEANLERLRSVLLAALGAIDETPACPCAAGAGPVDALGLRSVTGDG